MTNFWIRNTEAFGERYEGLKEILESIEIDSAGSGEEKEQLIAGVEEIAGRKVLYAVENGIQYQLDSLYDSDYVVDTWFTGLTNLRFQSKVVMFGLGNGMYVRKLLDKTKKDVSVLIYEPSLDIFMKAMEHFDLHDILLNERVILIIKNLTPVLFGECLREFIHYEDLSGMLQCKYMNYSKIFMEEAKYFNHELEMTYSYEDAVTSLWERHGKIYYSNTMSNINQLYKSRNLRDLWDKIPKTLPAIVVAAGPSLDKNIELLKEAKGKCFMIAADSALKPLLKHDIIPDLFISIDGGKNINNFDDLRINQIPMVCNLQSQERLLQRHNSEKFFIRGIDIYVQKFMEEKGIIFPILKTGGSVANDCFELARIMGLKTIILVGQDLAYTNNKTHSAETLRGGWDVDTATLQTIEVEGIDGRPILSSYEFQIYLHWFEERIRMYPELKVIDATEGGAKIHGTLVQELKETIQEECRGNFDMERCIQETGTLLTTEEQAELKCYMNQIPGEIQRAVYLMKQCIRDYEKLEIFVFQNQYRTKESLKLFQKISKTTGQVEEISAMEYVQNHMQEEITQMLDTVYDVQDDEKKEMLEVCNLGKAYLEKMLKTAEEILPDIEKRLLRTTIKRIVVVVIGKEITTELQLQLDKYNTPLTELFVLTGIADTDLNLNNIFTTPVYSRYQQGDGREYEFVTDMKNLYKVVTFLYRQVCKEIKCCLLVNSDAAEAILEPIYEQIYYKYNSRLSEMEEMEEISARSYYYEIDGKCYLPEPVMGIHMFVTENGIIEQNEPIDNVIYLYPHVDELMKETVHILTSKVSVDSYKQLHNIFETVEKNRNYQISEFEFRMFLMGVEDCYTALDENKDIYRIYCSSYLAIQTGSSRYLEQMNYYVLHNTSSLSAYNKYFYWQQQARMFLKNMNLVDGTGNADTIYRQVYTEFAAALQSYLVPIAKEARNRESYIILTVQFLSENHAPTKTALERIYTLGSVLGKKLTVINTREKLSAKGLLPVYDVFTGNVVEKYNEISTYEYKGYQFDYYQCPCEMPDIQEMASVLTMIRREKPYMLLTIGTGSIISDLAAKIVPVLNIPVGFSNIKKYDNQFSVVGRTISDSEKQSLQKNGYCLDSIIESTFTFELKEQTHHFRRSDLNLPEDKFLLLTVGIRLHYEVTEEFIMAVEPILQEEMHLVFAGCFTNYEQLCERYTIFKEHSTFLGYQDDILAINELCDLYVNPKRLGGGFSIAEAFYHGKPGITIDYGDVAATAGSDFQVKNYDEMVRMIRKYRSDNEFYKQQSQKALERFKIVTDSEKELKNIIEEAESRKLFF